MDDDELLFEVVTSLGFTVRCFRNYWAFIVGEKHPALVGHEDVVRTTLTDPDEIRRSKRDPNVFLFYRGQRPRWVCAVVRRENGEGFLITAYPTDAIKAGEELWTRSK